MNRFDGKDLLAQNLTDIMHGKSTEDNQKTAQLPADIKAEDEYENIYRAKAIREAGYARVDIITPADLGASKEVQREMRGEGILTLWRHPLKPNNVLMFMKKGDIYSFGGVIKPD